VIRAYVQDNIASLSVDISIVDHPPEGSWDARPRILHLPPRGGHGAEWEEIDQYGAVGDPTLRLGHEEARALLDALAARFQGAEDTRALRRDYDQERGRSDRLIGHLADVAKALAAAPAPPAPVTLRAVRDQR
jgi:hypothetical protein